MDTLGATALNQRGLNYFLSLSSGELNLWNYFRLWMMMMMMMLFVSLPSRALSFFLKCLWPSGSQKLSARPSLQPR